ncbi:MAG: gamma-glutamyl-gamma-aminobutyrate hydrolase family protein [Armatimonadetes bacterium]|nr:gamma-glutamyl-gamma-aminobutyrate hydrolase family protein [Armatimonadota bacterium]
MVLIVSMARKTEYDASDGATGLKRKFEELARCPVVVLHYTEVTPRNIELIRPRAVFITGFGYSWSEIHVPDLYNLNDFLHSTEVPVYGACGGHQLIGFCFNRNLRRVKRLRDEPMRRLRPGETDLGPVSHNPGYYIARGFTEVQVVAKDPIFDGLGRKIRVLEAHYCEVKKLPPGFKLLATSQECKIEMMRHCERPIYGAQFHAEVWQEPYMDGKRIMSNFFRIAGLGE